MRLSLLSVRFSGNTALITSRMTSSAEVKGYKGSEIACNCTDLDELDRPHKVRQ